MSTLNHLFTRAELDFGLRWMLATIGGWLLGFTLCFILKAFVESLEHIELDGALMGLSIGFVQRLVLRERFKHAGWWILASALGFAMGKGFGDAIALNHPGTVGITLTGALIGALIGILQWPVLRHGGLWVLASVLAWVVGWGIISFVYDVDTVPVVISYLVGSVGAAAVGMITAVALVRLSRLHFA